ncbi:MAG TPA: endo alpha-1,4 polygalactosaminidase [Actinomycetota bacterium]|nr:endo alpha-1,4 polygalactosaminidase [Actinomycetota bacterium]
MRLTVLHPTGIVDATGTHSGNVGALAKRDQSGARDDPSRYVWLRGRGRAYGGYRNYTLPGAVSPADVTTITLTANFRGPIARANAWTWAAYDREEGRWVRLGDQRHCGGDAGTAQWPCDDLQRRPWKYVRYNVIPPSGEDLSDFIDPSTGQMRIRLRASRSGRARLDWEALEVYSNPGPAEARWTPPVGARWQWQLEGRAGHHLSTGGIAVGICQPPFGGATCVRPDLFDIDLYVDPAIAGRFGYRLERPAVKAIHASDRHVIGYVTAGDIERWRPDYEQFIDFDRRCDGCLRGKPFSKRFPDEYWANLNKGQGQFAFMLQMLRARTDRVAATGFDGIEYDIVDTYDQGRQTTGFKISAQRQLAYNRALARMAHADGLSVALKNDGGQIQELLHSFDFAINEQCFQYDECAGGGYPSPGWRAFIEAGKAVFQAEYRLQPRDFCRKANRWDFSSIVKSRDFSLYALPWTPCR